jgi:GT2 family glycosyltransferase
VEIAFVILNYNTYEETVECVNSIEDKIDTNDYRIVIVDNASKDESTEKLRRFVKDKNFIDLLCNKENLGFARGNNVGIRYVNNKYSPKFVVVLNSDTELIQMDLLDKLNKEFTKSDFALLGPLILTANGRCDNSPHTPPNKEQVLSEIKVFQKEFRIISCGLYRIYCGIRFLKESISTKLLKKEIQQHRNEEFHKYQKQVVVQGCFLVFSNKAFDYIEGFDESTFLYYEEPILYLNLIYQGLTVVYNPEICIYHKDGCATNNVEQRTKDKLLFINQCYQKSANVLLDVLSRYE